MVPMKYFITSYFVASISALSAWIPWDYEKEDNPKKLQKTKTKIEPHRYPSNEKHFSTTLEILTRSSLLYMWSVFALWYANSALIAIVTSSVSYLCYNACHCPTKKYKKYISLHHMRQKLLQSISVKPDLSLLCIFSISLWSFLVSCCKREKWCPCIIVCWDRVKIPDMELLL